MVFMDRSKIKKLEKIGWKKTKEEDLPFIPTYRHQSIHARTWEDWADSCMRMHMYESEIVPDTFLGFPCTKGGIYICY